MQRNALKKTLEGKQHRQLYKHNVRLTKCTNYTQGLNFIYSHPISTHLAVEIKMQLCYWLCITR
jgi:hypothetical protein